MIVPKDLTKRFSKVKQKGDIKILMKLLKFKNRSSVSSVMSGDRPTTLDKIEKVKFFIEQREKQIESIIG